MWRVMLYLSRPNGCRLGAASQSATVVGRKGASCPGGRCRVFQPRHTIHEATVGLNSPGSGRPAGRVASGQVQPLKLLQPFLSGLSPSKSFATKASTQQPPAKPDPSANQAHDWFASLARSSTPKKTQAPPASVQLPGVPETPAPERGRTHKQPHLQTPATQSRNNGHKPSPSVADTSGSSPGADHERRQSSLSDTASTSGTAPSSAGTSKSRSSSRAALNSYPSNTQAAVSSNGAAAAHKAPEALSASNPRHSGPSPAPPPAVLGGESTGNFRVSSHSSALFPTRQGINPNTAILGTQHNPVSAATSNVVHGTASLPSASEEPSMYAQKTVPFDVSASRKSGTTAIRDLLETQKITLQEYAPGQKPKVLCPRCHGGSQHEASLAVNISVDSQSAAWLCHRATCGWQGAIDQKTGTFP